MPVAPAGVVEFGGHFVPAVAGLHRVGVVAGAAAAGVVEGLPFRYQRLDVAAAVAVAIAAGAGGLGGRRGLGACRREGRW